MKDLKRCPKCSREIATDEEFCPYCGTRVQPSDVKFSEGGKKEPRTSILKKIRWGWVFRCIIIVLILSGINMYVLGRIYGVPVEEMQSIPNSAKFLPWLLIILFSSFITALLSPGKTIVEPAIACAFLYLFAALVNGNVVDAMFGWLLPYFLSIGGARMGEFVAGKFTKKKLTA